MTSALSVVRFITHETRAIALALVLLLTLPGCATGPAARPHPHPPVLLLATREQRLAALLAQARTQWDILSRVDASSPESECALHEYNRAVTQILAAIPARDRAPGWAQDLTAALGWHLQLQQAPTRPPYPTYALREFSRVVPAARVRLHKFDQVVARPGIGVPVVLAQDNVDRVAMVYHPPRGEFLPATAVLEFIGSSAREARLRFYNPFAVSEIPVGPHRLRLAENITAALESAFIESSVRSGKNPHGPAPSASAEEVSHLYFLQRYDPAKIPVIFVHGLRCGPGVWKNTVNALLADPDLRRRYQPVCFIYPTKLPVPIAAARLRELLVRSRQDLDPVHRDHGYSQLILVGHSMGGLLARFQVTESENDFWPAFFDAPPAEVEAKLDPKTAQVIHQALFFHAQPNIKMIVFIGVPHRGSVLADQSLVRAVARLILFLPRGAEERLSQIARLPHEDINPVLRKFYNVGEESTESLSTEHPMFRVLEQHPVQVPFHSIIGTLGPLGAKKLEDSTDGLVPYWSSHLDGALSETILPFPHGCLERPGTVQAINHILKETK